MNAVVVDDDNNYDYDGIYTRLLSHLHCMKDGRWDVLAATVVPVRGRGTQLHEGAKHLVSAAECPGSSGGRSTHEDTYCHCLQNDSISFSELSLHSIYLVLRATSPSLFTSPHPRSRPNRCTLVWCSIVMKKAKDG